MMTAKWCPRCRRDIPEPPTNPTSTYAKFWRDKLCYICDSRLLSLAESPRSATAAGTDTVPSLPAEPRSAQSAPRPAQQVRHSDHDADVTASATGSGQIDAERPLDNGAQATALRRLVHSALLKQGWLKQADLDDIKNRQASLRWHAEQVDLVAVEALKAFPGRDWESNSADDRFDEFIDLAVMNRQSNRLHSFGHSAELFLSGHRGAEYRAGYGRAHTQPSATIVSNGGIRWGLVERTLRGLTRLLARMANAGLVLTSVLDGLLNASGRFHWESVRHWPIVRSYNPERYEPYLGLTGGWSPLGSWHNALVLGVPFAIAFALSAFLQWAAGRAIDKDGRSVSAKLVWIRPWGRLYFVLLYVAAIGSVIALWSPEIFASPEAVPLAVQLALGACVSVMLAHDNSTLLTEDLIEDLAKASWM